MAFVAVVPSGLLPADDRTLWFVSLIVRTRAQRAYHYAATEATYIPLRAQQVRQMIGRDYKKTVTALIETGVIECDGKFQFFKDGRRGKCLGYRLGQAWWGSPTVAVTITSQQLIANLTKFSASARANVTHRTHRHLLHWFEQASLDESCPYGEHVSADLFIDSQKWFILDKQERIHTNLTTLPKRFRKYVQCAGRTDFTSVDVSTCQPFLVALDLLARRASAGEAKKGGEKTHTQREIQLPALRCDAAFIDFRNCCQNGTIYDKLTAITGIRRQKQKERLLAVLYGRSQNTNTATGRAMDVLFPGVLDVLRKDDAGARLARKIQRDESHVMIHDAARMFMQRYPNEPILTIHDCLVVPTSFADLVNDCILEAWRYRFTHEPTLKRERWE